MSQTIHNLASSVLFDIATSVNSSSARAHTHRDIWQSNKECLHVSTVALQMVHAGESAFFLWFWISPVGIDVLASRHVNTLIFDRILNLQSLPHDLLSASQSE